MKQIEITTAQHVTITYDLAKLSERLFAMVIDIVTLVISYTILSIVISLSFHSAFSTDTSSTQQAGFLIIRLLPFFTFVLYHFLSELLMDGQTLGKKAMGIKVVKLDGSEASASDYLIRALFQMVDSMMSLGLLGVLFVLASDKNQRLGDFAANTSVIKIRFANRFSLSDILKIKSLANQEVEYPEVRQFSEQDMLLIKKVLNRSRKYNNRAHREVVDELVERLRRQLGLLETPGDKMKFLKTLIRDYIVLTR